MTKSFPGFLILAAGQATRFGGHKLIQPINKHQSVIEAGLDRIIKATSSISSDIPIGIVVSKDNDVLAAHLNQLLQNQLLQSHPQMQLLRFPGSSPGLGDSIRFAVEATSDWQGWFICLADMPLIKVETYTSLLALSKAHNIVIPTQHNHPGHPVYFSHQFAADLLALHGDKGAKRIWQDHHEQCHFVEVNDPGIQLDIDSKQDLEQAQQHFISTDY